MKTASWIVLTALAFTTATAQAALASETGLAVTNQMNAVDSEVIMKVDVELRSGVFAYTSFGTADLSFVGREISSLTVNSKSNRYEAVFAMKVAPVDFGNDSDLRAVEILRTDSSEGRPTGHTHLVRTIVEKGVPAQVVVPGKFQGQRRDFRLTFHY